MSVWTLLVCTAGDMQGKVTFVGQCREFEPDRNRSIVVAWWCSGYGVGLVIEGS